MMIPPLILHLRERLSSRGVAAILGSTAIHVALFLILFAKVGAILAAFALLPSSVIAWYLGATLGSRASWLAGLWAVILNSLLFILVGENPVTKMIGEGAWIGTLVIFIFSAVVGWLRQIIEDRTSIATQLRTVAELSQQLNTVHDTEQLLEQTINLLQDRFDLYHIHLYLYDERGQRLVMRIGSGEVGQQMRDNHHQIALDSEVSLVARAARTRAYVLCNDVRREATFLPNPLLPNTHAELALPLISPTHLLGVLDVQDDRPQRFSQAEVDIFNVLAGQIATALASAELFKTVSDNLENTKTRLRVSQGLAGSQTEEEVLDVILKQASTWAQGDVSIATYAPGEAGEASTLVVRRATHHRKCFFPVGMALTEHSFPLLNTLAHAQPFITGNLQEDMDLDPLVRQHATEEGMVSLAVLPLMVGSERLGLLLATTPTANAFEDERAMMLCRPLAEQGAIALRAARLFDETQLTAERLREVDRLKSEFLANMSHELRTPLNSIIGFTEILLMGLDGPLNDGACEDIEAIRSSSYRLLYLINDVLDLAKIEAGHMTLEKDYLSVRALLETLRMNHAALLRDKAVQVEIDVEEELPSLWADPLRLTQIMTNLLSNAIKFTDKGTIWLRARREADTICLEVEDSGIGMTQADLATIFEQFTQVDPSQKRRAGGTGLGLPITRHLTKMHGGDIHVRSERGKGSIFTVCLPHRELETTPPVDPQSEPVPASL